MQIRVKLMGILKDKAPSDGVIELSAEASIEDALGVLDIPVESVQVFTVNGKLVRDRTRSLAADDELTVLPPVGGG
jgi:sulfur carrier protein ThiS